MLKEKVVIGDNNEETHIKFDSQYGTISVKDELYRQSIILNLEDVEMIVNTIRKAIPNFMG